MYEQKSSTNSWEGFPTTTSAASPLSSKDFGRAQKHSGEPAANTLLKILLATTLTLCAVTAIVRPKGDLDDKNSNASSLVTAPTPAEWASIASEFVELGATVRPYSADHPNVMEIQAGNAMAILPAEAKTLANSAHSRLGYWSVVLVRNSAGHVIARATQ